MKKKRNQLLSLLSKHLVLKNNENSIDFRRSDGQKEVDEEDIVKASFIENLQKQTNE